MTEYTKHLRLIKPGGNDYYNIDDFNQNSELIDKETEKLNNAVTEIKNGATREKAGIVQYGTTEGKALEGMMLARMFGCVGYGGDIQEAGVKDVNYIYYDRNTRKMYKCLNQNNDVSANVANFIPLDNNSLLERLENLIKIKKYSATTQDYLSINSGTLIISEVGISNLKNKIGIPSNSTIVSVTVGQSAGYCEYCTYNYDTDTAHIGHIVPVNNSRAAIIHIAYI